MDRSISLGRFQLLFGPAAMEHLSNCRMAVFGISGAGGYAVEALVRSGIGALDLIDDDRVCLTNLNRQLHAIRKTVGKYKVDVAEERMPCLKKKNRYAGKELYYVKERK